MKPQEIRLCPVLKTKFVKLNKLFNLIYMFDRQQYIHEVVIVYPNKNNKNIVYIKLHVHSTTNVVLIAESIL